MANKELMVPELPMSREVRLAHGVTHGAMEHQVHRAAEGGTTEELGAINALELIIADERRKAAEEVGRILLARIHNGFGNIVAADLKDALREFAENEILEVRHMDHQISYGAEE